MVKNILRLEGLTVFISSLYFYSAVGGNWFYFILLILAPDLSMVGYLKSKKLGSITYNLVHNYILGAALVFLGLFTNDLILSLGIILIAHVGIDRFFGFGLKYPTNFKDTHLQKV